MRKRFLGIATTLAVAGCWSSVASAEATSSASLEGFVIQLYDLNPLDSIAPAVVFSATDGSLAATFASTANPYSYNYGQQYSGSAFGAANASSVVGGNSGSAAISRNGATTDAVATANDYSYAYGNAFLGDGGAIATFTLSTDTLMVIRATASLTASTTQSSLYDEAGSQVDLELSGSGPNSSQSSSASFQTLAGSGYGYPTAASAGGAMAVSFVNASSTDTVVGIFVGDLMSWAQTAEPVSTVPEPTNIALLFAGLGALRMLSQRRQRGGEPQ
jgi:hypothetical protein